MFHRMVIVGLLALGTGTAWGDTLFGSDTNGLRYAAASVSDDSALQRGVNFNGVVFPIRTHVANDIDLTQADGTLYYERRQHDVLVNLGLALRFLDGSLQMTAADYASRVVFDGFVPLFYGRVRFDLPWYSLYTAMQAEAMSQGSDELLDANLFVGWTSPTGIGVEAGYRRYRLKLHDYDQLDRLDIELSGPYAAIQLHF
jgi:outer membrane protein